jgi:hypothetical protein
MSGFAEAPLEPAFANSAADRLGPAEAMADRQSVKLAAPALTAGDVARGLRRLLLAEGYSPISEFTLSNGRRLDVAALGSDGTVMGLEIKVSVADLRADDKWPDYLPYCDLFYFAVPPSFPQHCLPTQAGLVIADRYGGAVVRPAPRYALHATRRRAVTLRFAQIAAERLTRVLDPHCE